MTNPTTNPITRIRAFNGLIIILTIISSIILGLKMGFRHEDYAINLTFLITFFANPLAICILLSNREAVSNPDLIKIINGGMKVITGFSILILTLIILKIMTPELNKDSNAISSLVYLSCSYVMMTASYLALKKMIIATDDEDKDDMESKGGIKEQPAN